MGQPTSFTISSQQDLEAIDFSSFIRTRFIPRLSAEHGYQFENYHDENAQPVDINDYIHNGVVKKVGTVYAQVRATGVGLFPNTSNNALTVESVQLNFEVVNFDLSFNLNGAVGTIPETQKLPEGELATVVDSPVSEGSRFAGWNTAADGSGIMWDFATTTMPTSDVTLYAQWVATSEVVVGYKLAFNLNGGMGVIPGIQTLEKNQLAVKPTTPSRADYQFLAWNTAQDGTGITWDFTKTTMPENNVTLYAQWTKNASQHSSYKLAFDLNGGSGIVPETQIVKALALTTKPTNPIKVNHRFLGWNTVKDGSGLKWDFDVATMPENDVTLYAQWEEVSNPKIPETLLKPKIDPKKPVEPISIIGNKLPNTTPATASKKTSAKPALLPSTGEKYASSLLGMFLVMVVNLWLLVNKKQWLKRYL